MPLGAAATMAMHPRYHFLLYMRILHPHSVSMSACKCDVLEHRLTQPPYLHYRHLDQTFELGGAFGLCTAYTLCGDYRYTVLTKTKLPNWNLPTRIGDQSAKLNFSPNFPVCTCVSCPELHLPRPLRCRATEATEALVPLKYMYHSRGDKPPFMCLVWDKCMLGHYTLDSLPVLYETSLLWFMLNTGTNWLTLPIHSSVP